MSEIKKCPFCNVEAIYETSREDYLGTVIPQLFCNSCKMIFEVENDSPYLDDAKTHDYLKEKLYKQFNTRKPMQEIVEKLEESLEFYDEKKKEAYYDKDWEDFARYNDINSGIYEALAIVKKVGGMNENI